MTNLNTAILGAKTAIAQQDYGKARAILTPIAANNPTSAATLHLARVEFFEGKPEAAALLIARFQAASPKHAWAQLLNAQIQFSLGDYSAARNAAQTAIALNSNTSKPANRVLLSINAGEKDAEAKTLIKTLNLAKLEAGNDSFSSEVLDAAQSLSQFSLGPDWNDDPVNATIAYFRNAPNLDVALRNYDPHLIDVATRFDYITWPKRIQDHVIGKSVLDVGCGFGGYGMGFLVAGAVGYVGLDPVMELDSPCAKNKRTRAWEDMGITPREIAAALPAIKLIESPFEDVEINDTFDTIVLHNVTEHLIQLETVFGGLVRFMCDPTRVVFLHHNYYGWNGHHFPPHFPHQLDEADAEHQEFYDWRHIEFAVDPPEDHYIKTDLNRVRLDEIKAITAKHFDIETWEEIPSSGATLARLSPEILTRVRAIIPNLSKRDLSINTVFCVAKMKPK